MTSPVPDMVISADGLVPGASLGEFRVLGRCGKTGALIFLHEAEPRLTIRVSLSAPIAALPPDAARLLTTLREEYAFQLSRKPAGIS